MIVPTRQSLARPLTKLTSAWRENNLAAPAGGEILDSCGLIGSTENTIRC